MVFSVVIPAFNCEKTIAQTVQSICDVKIDDMEVIIVDDGSRDHTREVCKRIMEKYPCVRYFYQENAGVSAARNYGISQAIGKFILFWDSDDKADTRLLRKCMLNAQEKDADMLIFGMIFRRKYKGKVIQIEKKQCENEVLLSKAGYSNYLAKLFDINYLSSSCNKILKKEICNRVLFNTKKKSFEDFLFILECFNVCETVYLMPDTAYIYDIESTYPKSTRAKSIDDFDKYMYEFQKAVVSLERTLNAHLVEMRNRIGRVYEWLLSEKIKQSNYWEIKRFDTKKMKVSLFGEPHDIQMRINRLFFKKKYRILRAVCLYYSFRSVIVLKAKYYLSD